MGVNNLDAVRARRLAEEACQYARSLSPKMSGNSSAKIYPVWAEGLFGVQWEHPYLWYQEAGIRPFTNRSLAGKTIPMWVNDPKGEERRKNPKAETRQTVDGRTQVLIFRRAAKMGQRKNAWRNVNGQMVRRQVPASYPGAPGRIAVNRSQGIMRVGDIDPTSKNPGNIAKRNVGVRWRHPGLDPSRFLAKALYSAAVNNGLPVSQIEYFLRGNTKPYNTYSILIHGG